MAYIGVPQPSRAITSADIAQGAVTLNDISFTDVPANMDISGTIDKHTMRLAEGVTVTGDITISDNLILSKISDDGVGITLTNDSSTRTITGSGSIEASTLAQTPNASLTGMTGALGSEVTGTIGSGVTFPAGHVINTWYQGCTSPTSIAVSSASWHSISTSRNITITSGNKLALWWAGGVKAVSATHWAFNMYIDGVSVGEATWGTGIYHGTAAMNGWLSFGAHSIFPISSTGTVSCELKLKVNGGSITVAKDGNVPGALGDNVGYGYDGVHWLAQEIQA
jgi:hypothetical protein